MHSNGKTLRLCPQCGTQFLAWNSRIRKSKSGILFCSRECYRSSLGDLARRFWSNINKDGPIPPHVPGLGPCWIWTAGKFDPGYGVIDVAGKSRGAHRVSYELEYGIKLEADQFVCHKCDNPPCVNPSHLFLGDQIANNLDRDRKGRTAKGTQIGNVRLTPDQVRMIRKLSAVGQSDLDLSRQFQIDRAAIRYIRIGHTWKSVV